MKTDYPALGLFCPPEWHYELSTLIREVFPFAEVTATEAPCEFHIAPDGQSGFRTDEEGREDLALSADDFRFPGDHGKNCAKQLIFRLLHARLPWGILTGVRPTKVAYAYLVQGLSEEQVRDILISRYYLRPDKASLCVEVAGRESALLSDHTGTDASIYIGIPFCPTRCAYCSFISNDYRAYAKYGKAYVDCLIKEIEAAAPLLSGRRLQSFYMGGGTPTTLSAEQMDRVLCAAETAFGISALREATVEAGRPDTITEEKLLVLREHDIGRLSVNPQTMHQCTLDKIGRRHTVEDIYRAFEQVRKVGFPVVNMDFILGLQDETPEMVRESMEAVKTLRPENLTIHTLAIKRASSYNERRMGADLVKEGDKIEQMLSICADTARTLGLHPYYMYRQKNMAGNFENVGYAVPGTEGLYNIEIMEERQTILALGAGGVTKLYYPAENRIERLPNVKTADEYIKRLSEMIERKEKGGIRL